jgi:hypothetical protein
MKFRIHFTLKDGTEDSVVVSGDTIEEIREKAEKEVSSRGGLDPWSESLVESKERAK